MKKTASYYFGPGASTNPDIERASRPHSTDPEGGRSTSAYQPFKHIGQVPAIVVMVAVVALDRVMARARASRD